MRSLCGLALCSFALVALACASTQVTGSQNGQLGKIARPDRILVYDFAATPADIPTWSSASGQHAPPSTPQTAEAIETGRALGARVARELVAEIRNMGLPAVLASGQPLPQPGDIVIIGYFESTDEGSAGKRIIVGFGAGGSRARTQAEGYLKTDEGFQKLGSRQIDSEGGKTPGLIVPLAVTVATSNPIGLIASSALKVGGEATGRSTLDGSATRTAKKIGDELRIAFEKQGWI
jgi:hypothetical protein